MSFDEERIHLTVARFTKFGDSIEIVIDPDLALAYRDGSTLALKDVIKSDKIFSDAQNGEIASPAVITKMLGECTNDQALDKILKEGQIHFTANFLKLKREEKRRQIIQSIHENAMDPKTRLPHPLTRIENALDHIKFSIDPFESAEKQSDEIIKKLNAILPITIAKKTIQITVPAKYAPKIHGKLQGMGTKVNESWAPDGSLVYVCSVSAGGYERIISFLAQATHGSSTVEELL